MLLLEVDDDDHDFLYAFLMWSAAVAGLILWSKHVHRRDAARIDAAAAGRVSEVRARVHAEREGAREQAAAGADGGRPSAAAAAGAAAVPPPVPREREDCPICLDRVSWPIDTNCAHTFCAQCFLSYHDQAGGIIQGMVKCPCCRRDVDVILPTEPGWTASESDSSTGRELRHKIDAYNTRFGRDRQRGLGDLARDTPHYLSRFWRALSSGGPETWLLLRQARLWILLLTGLAYMLSPIDLLPEFLFGVVGMIDDLFVLGVIAMMVGGLVRNLQMAQAHVQIM